MKSIEGQGDEQTGRRITEIGGGRRVDIMNGVKGGDEKGEMTFTGERGETVIDYVLEDRGRGGM